MPPIEVKPQFSANLSMMFQELPFMERFSAAAERGFKAVEFMFPYDYSIAELQRELVNNDLTLILFNMPAGDISAGERGIPPMTLIVKKSFDLDVYKAADYAKALNLQINCLVGKKLIDVPEKLQFQCMIKNLRFAAEVFSKIGVRLEIEHLNSYDMPNFLLNTTKEVLDLINVVDHPNIYLQYDVYHAQRMEGELAGILRANLSRISHIQIADNPGRHQPGTGEINYRWLLADFMAAGYDRYIGLEYVPTPDSAGSLGWVSEYGYSL